MNIYNGWTESEQATRARQDRIQAWSEQRQICADMVAEVGPMFDKLGEALETAYSIPEEMFPFIFRTAELTCVSELDGTQPSPTIYDFTPIPRDMPIIDMDGIEEIPF